MSENFDWRTEEDGEWDGDRPGGRPTVRRRRWALPLIIIAVALVAGGAIYWQVQQRLAATETAIGDDIRSSFQLIQQAIAEDDIELFRNLLSGSDLGWAAAQQELFAQKHLYDLSPFGLAGEPESITDIEVTLSPELRSAEVAAVLTYPGSQSGALQLRQTSVFRRGERWVWSPPRDDFWAGQATVEERYLAVTYPIRDETLALRLARDLDLLVATMCRDVAALTCPADLAIELALSRDPATLVLIGERFASQGLFGRQAGMSSRRGQLLMTLPTPSLLGEPVDETGYEALRKGYSAQLALALAERLVDRDCCGDAVRLRAAGRAMLSDLGLDPWFGLAAPAGGQAEELPERDQVALLCSDGFERQQRLFLLDLADMTWQEGSLPTRLLGVKAVPGYDGVVLLSQVQAKEGVRSQVWRNSPAGNVLMFDMAVSEAQAEQISWELQEQQGLLVVEVPELRGGYSRYYTIDLGQCGSDGCQAAPQSTVSRPVWSPNGTQLMVRAYGLLWWRIGPSMVPIGDGSAPFWIDEARYGYVRDFGQEQAVVMVQPEQEPAESAILTTADLRDVAGLDGRSGRLLIGRVIVSQLPEPAGETGGEWLVLAIEIGGDGALGQARFFLYEFDSQEVRLLPHNGRLLSFNLAPRRDKMALGGFVADAGRWEITVVGRELGGAATVALDAGGSDDAVPSYSWSPDESWLLMLDQGVLTLFEPDTGRVQRVRPPEASCVQAAWYAQVGSP